MDVPEEGNEFETYLAAPRIPVTDVLRHWQSMLPSPIAHMALDVLTAPGTSPVSHTSTKLMSYAASSADVERSFSSGGLTVSKKRHALTDESIRAATLLASWQKSGIKELLPEHELVAAVKAKSRRAKKGGEIVEVDEAEGDAGDVE